MKRTLSLRNQLSIWLALLVLLQSAALIMALIFSNVFLLLDADAFLKLKNTTQMRSEGVNAAFGQVVYNVATQTRRLNEELLLLAQTNGYELQGIYQNDASYEETVLVAGESVLSLLRNNQVTGAFFLLNGSNKNVENGNAHAGIYLRNSTPGGSGQGQENLLLEMGPVSVAKEYHIPTSIRWSLDILLEQEDPRASIYTKPIWASKEKPKVSLEHYGYWSKPMDILRDNRFVVCHSLPVFDENGQAFAVLGIELDVTYFTQTYLSSADLMYPNSFYIITEQQAGELPLSWLIPGGPLAQVYLQEKNSQSLSSVNAGVEEIYRTSIHGLGKMYSVVAPLSVYSKNSPFAGEDWSLVSFVPQDELHHGTIVVRQNLLISIVVTTLLSFVVIFIIIYFATRKIAGLSKYVSALSPYDEIRIRRTGMQEIDELSAAVEMLNESVINASKTTSKILDMSLLPIGGFERLEEQNHVVVTSYVRELLHLEAAKQLSIADWDVLFQQLMAEPLANYENVYQYQQKNGTSQETLFLRIVETTAPTGTVGVILDVTRDIQEQRRLAHELDYDSLTHLYNRIAFKREVNRQICGQPGKVGAMIFADIDNLKYINDTFGHDAGDRLIMRAGERFREFVAFGGLVSRISGDEFAIYLHGYESQEEIREFLKQQFKRNEAYHLITPDGASNRIRFSAGIAWYPKDSDNVTDLLKLSDFAMYEAKRQEKGTLVEFSPASYQKTSYLLDNREAINRLIDEALIHFAYQPVVDLKTGEVFAYEALLRSRMEKFKSPQEILDVAAAQSKLGMLERMVIMMAFEDVHNKVEKLGHCKVFINSIPSQIISLRARNQLRKKYGHIFHRIVLEIIEAENKNPQELQDKVEFLRSNGIQLALDDFGKGYSSEIRILEIQPDIVKIDMALIQGIHGNKDKQSLVANMISFCHGRGIKLIAEGVEEAEDLKELIRLGIDYVQGYYLARPQFEILDIPMERKEEIRFWQNEKGS